VLAKMAEGSAIGRIEVAADQQGNFSYSVA